MKPQRRGDFEPDTCYRSRTPKQQPGRTEATAAAMRAFLEGGGTVKRVEEVKESDLPGFRNNMKLRRSASNKY